MFPKFLSDLSSTAFVDSPFTNYVNSASSRNETWDVMLSNKTHLVCSIRDNLLTQTQMLYTTIICVTVAVLGILGNSIVIAVFQKAHDKQFRQLIFALALTDLFSCSIVLPVDLYHIYHAYSFNAKKLSLSVSDHAFQDFFLGLRNTTFAIEGVVLLCVALDRYFCICHPQKKRLVTNKFLITTIGVSFTALCSLETSVTVIHLFFDEDCRRVAYLRRVVTYSYLSLAFLGMLIFATLYCNILVAARRLENRRCARLKKGGVLRSFHSLELLSSPATIMQNTAAPQNHPTRLSPSEDPEFVPGNRPRVSRCHSEMPSSNVNHLLLLPAGILSSQLENMVEEKSNFADPLCTRNQSSGGSKSSPSLNFKFGDKLRQNLWKTKRISNFHSMQRFHKTAAMLFGTTVVFHATLVPSIMSHVLQKDVSASFQRVYYINNAANVILYSLLNANFRKDVKTLFETSCRSH